MSVYRLTNGSLIKNRKGAAKWFSLDMDFLINTCSDIGKDVESLKEKKEKGIRSISESRPELVNDETSRLVSAIFLADAQWNEPIARWFSSPYSYFFHIMDYKIHGRWMQAARKYGEIDGLDFPRYSVPEDFEGAPSPRQDSRKGTLVYSLLDLEWFFYICRQTEIDLENELLEKSREETFQFFTGQIEELSPEVRDIQVPLLRNAGLWIDDTLEEFNFRSYILQDMSSSLKETASALEKQTVKG